MSDKKGYWYLQIWQRVYCLNEAIIIAYDYLVKNSALFGYNPCQHIQESWTHKACKTTFRLFIENFGVKYHSKADTEHLIQEVNTNQETKTNWDSKGYCGLMFD